MRTLRYNLAPTLNGVIASLPSHTTTWIVDDPTIDFASLYAEFDTFIMGRKTYETFRAMGADNPLLGRAKEDVIVFTRGSDAARSEWEGEVTDVGGGVVEYVRGLKEENGGREVGAMKKDIWLMGGGELAGTLMRAGLVDVIEAAIMPAVVLDGGVKIFGEGVGSGSERDMANLGVDRSETEWKLKLEKAEVLDSGILMTRYRVLYD